MVAAAAIAMSTYRSRGHTYKGNDPMLCNAIVKMYWLLRENKHMLQTKDHSKTLQRLQG